MCLSLQGKAGPGWAGMSLRCGEKAKVTMPEAEMADGNLIGGSFDSLVGDHADTSDNFVF